MVPGSTLQNRSIGSGDLSPRQREIREVVDRYTDVAGEPPSSGWLARRFAISRTAAWDYLRRLDARTKR